MISADELSGLLGFLYAAPLEPEKWQGFMERLCDVTSVSCGYFIGKYPGGNCAILAGGGTSFAPEMLSIYAEHYSKSDPYEAPLAKNLRCGVTMGDALVDRSLLVKTEVYNDFLRPNNMESTTVVTCSCTRDQLEALSLWRSAEQGAMDADSRKLLSILLPHMQTALRLRTSVLAHQSIEAFSEAALEAMSVAALLVSNGCRVRHISGRALKYVGKGAAFRVRGGRLVANDPKAAAQLDQIVWAATVGARSGADLAPGGAMRIAQPCDGRMLDVTVVPAPERDELAGGESCALIFVSDPAAGSVSRSEMMRRLYELTPTECRLADLLLEGLEVRESAEKLHITVETARFHLKRILSKTGTRRQAELIRLMMLLPQCRERE